MYPRFCVESEFFTFQELKMTTLLQNWLKVSEPIKLSMLHVEVAMRIR